ncbi:MAG: dipeptidase [Ignavibacteriales bacterium]|nr:dipeptidase [Ignavibacteriales bacterium]
MADLNDFIAGSKDRYLSELKQFLKFPSISTNPENKKDVLECAEYLKKHMESIGMQNAKVYPTKGHPVVYSDWLNAGADKPTVLIYGHYDVQPVDPVELWTSPPFEADIRGENIYARGSADDKGQVFIHLKAIEAHLSQNKTLPVNIKLLIEGEEEIGSVHLGDFIKDNVELLRCDVIVVSDTSMFSKELPALGYALRGLCYMQVDVTGPNRDLHSGQYGGSVENPINALAEMISKMKDADGKILIDGFYDDVAPLSKEEKENFEKLPFDDKEYSKGLEVDELAGEKGYSTLERIWSRPTLDCNGIWGGFTGEGAKTVLPSKASAKISMRLVPNQDPDKIAELFVKFVKKIAPKSIKVDVYGQHHGKPWISPIDSKWNQAAIRALKAGFGKEPVFMREGGSIPIVFTLEEYLKAPTVLLGFGLPDENAHSPDEHLNLNNFFNGIQTSAVFYNEIAKA